MSINQLQKTRNNDILSKEKRERKAKLTTLDTIHKHNPFAKHSDIKLSEIRAKGFRILETLADRKLRQMQLTGAEWNLFHAILDCTRGYSVSDKNNLLYQEATFVNHKTLMKYAALKQTRFYRALRRLKEKLIIYEVSNNGLAINFHYDMWTNQYLKIKNYTHFNFSTNTALSNSIVFVSNMKDALSNSTLETIEYES